MNRPFIVDLLIVVTVALLVVGAVLGFFVPVPRVAGLIAVLGLTLVAAVSVAGRFVAREDRLRARLSRQTLEIVDRSLPFLRKGLDRQTAQAVCDIILANSDAAAVAITDKDHILGFSGVGSDHHAPGGPVLTRATHEALASGEPKVLWSRQEIGCEVSSCPLAVAIVAPLIVRHRPEGTLKSYYSSPGSLTEPHVDMVTGLARLLSTQLELAELDRQSELATRMELQALQAQINPHFLFNTINTVASLIRTDPPEARRLLREFATFYRRTLEHGEDLIPLGRELEYTRSYLSLEHARFGDRIVIDERVSDAAKTVDVPAFVIQPLVENAIQHGMRPEGDLHVTIEGDVQDGCLKVRIRDDGRGIPAADVSRVFEPGFGRGLGIALHNVNERLRGHFGAASGLSIVSVEGRGTVATMSIVLNRTREGGCED